MPHTSMFFDLLDERERQTLDLVLAGHPNKAIGHRLGLSRRSVARIKSSILEKTRFLSFIELSGAVAIAAASDTGRASGCPARPTAAPGVGAAVAPDTSESQWQWLQCDLRDGAARYLSAALAKLQAFETRPGLPQGAPAQLRVASGLVDMAIRDIRDVIAVLASRGAARHGAGSFVRRLVREIAGPSGIEVELAEALDYGKLTPALETAVHRMLRESLSNAVRHSGSDRIRVEVAERPGTLRLEVRDWGKGFDSRAINGPHWGLCGIKQRAQLLNGDAVIESQPGQGTVVRIELPLAGAGAGRHWPTMPARPDTSA